LDKVGANGVAQLSSQIRKLIGPIGIAIGAVIILLTAVPAFSQSCALCYTQAASSGSRMIQALKSGILILILPSTLGSVGMIVVVYRKRNQVRRGDDAPDSDGDW
jgi:hypothetical protein